jgi:hypothetical protein
MALRGPTSTRPGYNPTPSPEVKGYEIPTKQVEVPEAKPTKKKGLFGRKK